MIMYHIVGDPALTFMKGAFKIRTHISAFDLPQ